MSSVEAARCGRSFTRVEVEETFVVALFARLPEALRLAEEIPDLSRCLAQRVGRASSATQHVVNLPCNRSRQLLFEEA